MAADVRNPAGLRPGRFCAPRPARAVGAGRAGGQRRQQADLCRRPNLLEPRSRWSRRRKRGRSARRHQAV
eukprot:7994511-Lingulodinium_polyedra.AAC.1